MCQEHNRNKLVPLQVFHLTTILKRKFWELEEIPTAIKITSDELACEHYFQETTTVENSKFVFGMPFKSDVPPLGDTFVQANKIFQLLHSSKKAEERLFMNLLT